MASVLVTGGAEYIGSHMVKTLAQAGHRVVVVDDLSTGHRDTVLHGTFVEGSIGDRRVLEQALAHGRIDAAMHFSANALVGESVQNPAEYYRNNVSATLVLLDALVAHGVRHFVFSSTCAVFGEPKYSPMDEQHPFEPINPYGRSKRMVEQALADYDAGYGLRYACLRYFN